MGPAIGDAEAGHHFVEHQQGAVFTGDFPQTFEEAEIGGDKAGIAHHRLEDHTGDRVGVFGKQGLDRLKVVVWGGEGVGGGAARYAGGVRQAQGGHTRAGLHQEHVGVAVVAAFELDHLFAAGVGAHQAQHGHAGLGSAVDEANHLHAGDGVDHHLGEGVFQGAGGAKAGALGEGLLQGLDHLGIGVSADGGSPAADVIDVAVAIHIPGVGAFDAIEHDRLAAHGAEGPNRGIHSAGHQLLRCRKEGVGTAGVQGCSSHQSVMSRDRASHSALAPLCSAIDRLN